MTGWTKDDAVMAELRNWLTDRGYVVLSDRYDPDSFVNQVVTLSRPVGVRLVKDRSHWTVNMCGRDGQWRELGNWSAALGHGRPRGTSAVEESDRLQALLGDIEQRPDAADNE